MLPCVSINAHRDEVNAGIKAALGQLNGTDTAVSVAYDQPQRRSARRPRRAAEVVPSSTPGIQRARAVRNRGDALSARNDDDGPVTDVPPKFVGMIKDGPADGSTAVDRGGVCLTAW